LPAPDFGYNGSLSPPSKPLSEHLPSCEVSTCLLSWTQLLCFLRPLPLLPHPLLPFFPCPDSSFFIPHLSPPYPLLRILPPHARVSRVSPPAPLNRLLPSLLPPFPIVSLPVPLPLDHNSSSSSSPYSPRPSDPAPPLPGLTTPPLRPSPFSPHPFHPHTLSSISSPSLFLHPSLHPSTLLVYFPSFSLPSPFSPLSPLLASYCLSPLLFTSYSLSRYASFPSSFRAPFSCPPSHLSHPPVRDPRVVSSFTDLFRAPAPLHFLARSGTVLPYLYVVRKIFS